MTDLENREAFEREYGNRFPRDKSTLLKSGKYSGWVKQASWEIWQASAQREGFKLVPLEPTMVMLNQVETEKECFFEVAADSYNVGISASTCVEIYKAMINAV